MSVHLFTEGMPRRDVPHVYMLTKIFDVNGLPMPAGAFLVLFESQIIGSKVVPLPECKTDNQCLHQLIKEFFKQYNSFSSAYNKVAEKDIPLTEMPFYIFLLNKTVIRHFNGLSCVGQSFHKDFMETIKLKAGLKPAFRMASPGSGWMEELRNLMAIHVELKKNAR